jgi:4-diphosphocytidyl-2-C-methyl-D-erythritol kinase
MPSSNPPHTPAPGEILISGEPAARSALTAAPAKVNLSLRVLHRRDDGFHQIDSLIAPLSLADLITLSELPDAQGQIQLSCSDPDLPTDADNLAYKAAELYLEHAPHRAKGGLAIHLEKQIPAGAGLGGGSSDAAATLRLLDALAPEGEALPPETLAEIAAHIGSDVPFFLQRQAAHCTGRGELIHPAPHLLPPEGLPLLLVLPPFAVSTPWAYSRWASSRPLYGSFYGSQLMPWGPLINDLERPVFARHLVLAELKAFLLHQPGVAGALMSGSGSAVFALLNDPTAAAALAVAVRSSFGPTFRTVATRASPPPTTPAQPQTLL